jgi:DNA primase
MDFKEQLKSSIDIVTVIGEYVRLKRQGSTGRYLGLCPFHQEKTPSFNVNQTRQFYKCFGCGVAGDALKFVMEIDGLTFPEAIKLLAERNGIPMPKRSDYSDPEAKLRGALFEMHKIAADLFQSSLRGTQGANARAYLEKRGVGAELIETFGLGFSESSGQALTRRLAQEQFTQEQLDKSGLVRRREDGSGSYDFFRGRLMVPIHDESGKVVAFGGRAMRDEDQPKYLNSPETPIYRKTSVLYNLHRARDAMRRSDRAVLVEGYMDVIGVYAAGIKEVVASCGTALTSPQVRTIHRHADTVIVYTDPDNAGRGAVKKDAPLLLPEGLHVRVLTKPRDAAIDQGIDGKGLDPDDYARQKGADGPEGLRARIDSADELFHWLADEARNRFDMATADGRMDAFRELLPWVEMLPDVLHRAAVANDLAAYLGVDASLVLKQFKKSAADRRAPAPVSAPRSTAPALERMLLNALLAGQETRDEILPRLDQSFIDGFVTREIFEALNHLVASGDPITFSALEERLTGPAQSLLHEIVSADEILDGNLSREQARNCLRRLESERHKRHVAALKAKVVAAQRDGQIEEARALAIELARAENARGDLS